MSKWWNPWRRIKVLEAQLAALDKEVERMERECDHLDRMATEAMGRTADYYNRRFMQENQHRAAMEAQIAQMVSLAPAATRVFLDRNPGFDFPVGG